jgi:SAM-dependent methyltransferase
MTRAAPPDFAAAWEAYLHERETGRLDATADRGYWERYAPHEDPHTAGRGACAQTLTVISSLVRIGDSLLDVGAGTGRLALPLARCVGHVTALDQAPATLEILRRRARGYGIENLTALEVDWETAEVEPHDVVLAAWSLYRLSDLRGALNKLVRATRRTLVIVAGDATDQSHRAAARAIWGGDGEPEIPEYLFLLGSLWQLGIRANLRVVQENRHFCCVTPREAAEQLAPIGARPEEIQRFAREMTALLEPRSDGWHYLYPFPVGILIWRRGT